MTRAKGRKAPVSAPENAPRAWPAMAPEMRKLAGLTPYERNARTHSEAQIAQIAASMREFGWTNPILVDEDGLVIAGHGRLAGAKALGWEEGPVIVARGWSAAQKRAYVIADNRIAEQAGWNPELLAIEFEALAGCGFDMSVLGFSDRERSDMIARRNAGLSAPDDVPEVPAEPVTKRGDVWVLGQHRLTCGDSTVKADVARALDGAQPHLMVTDPPYGVRYDASWRKKTGLAGKVAAGKVLNDDRADWREAWALFPGAVAYVWHGALHHTTVCESLAAAGFEIRAQIIWNKSRSAIGRGHYHWKHEPALYAVREGEEDRWNDRFEPMHEIAAYAVKEGEAGQWVGGRKQSTVWDIEHARSETGHSTQKPVECMRRPILNNSLGGDAVYDPFLGSGTTLIACEMEGRRCRGLELNPAYCDVIVARWEAFTGLRAEHRPGEKR